MSINENLVKLLNRLETTKIPTVVGQLRYVDPRGHVQMCPLGHLVDIWIEQTPGAAWSESDSSHYFDPTDDEETGFPSDEMMEEFGLDAQDAPKIFRQNDSFGKSPTEVAQFIREELVK